MCLFRCPGEEPINLADVPADYWSFIGVAALIVIVPGADMALVARNTLAGGRSAGLRTATGTILGLGVHAGAAVVGLSAVISTSASAFNIIKLIGAAYLVWLGLQTLWATRARNKVPSGRSATKWSTGRMGAPLMQGALTNLLNPKLAVFFLSFLPQFVDPARPASSQIIVLATTFIVMGALWLGTYIAAVDALAGVLARPAVKRWSDRVVGATLVGLGARLAVVRSGPVA